MGNKLCTEVGVVRGGITVNIMVNFALLSQRGEIGDFHVPLWGWKASKTSAEMGRGRGVSHDGPLQRPGLFIARPWQYLLSAHPPPPRSHTNLWVMPALQQHCRFKTLHYQMVHLLCQREGSCSQELSRFFLAVSIHWETPDCIQKKKKNDASSYPTNEIFVDRDVAATGAWLSEWVCLRACCFRLTNIFP